MKKKIAVVFSIAMFGIFAFSQVSAISWIDVYFCRPCWEMYIGGATWGADPEANCYTYGDPGDETLRCCPGDYPPGQDYFEVWTCPTYHLHPVDCWNATCCGMLGPLVNYRINTMSSLLNEFSDLIEQAKAEGIDVSEYEELLEDAEKCFLDSEARAQSGNFCSTMCLPRFIKALEEAIEELEDLIS